MKLFEDWSKEDPPPSRYRWVRTDDGAFRLTYADDRQEGAPIKIETFEEVMAAKKEG